MRLALRQNGLPQLQQAADDVSAPQSPSYGRHLSLERVCELVKPLQTHIDDVMQFLGPCQPLVVFGSVFCVHPVKVVTLFFFYFFLFLVLLFPSLASHDATAVSTSPCLDYVTATLPRVTVEALLDVTLEVVHRHTHPLELPPIVRSHTRYSIPSAVAHAVRAVDWVTFERGVDVPSLVPASRAAAAAAGVQFPGQAVTPPVLHKVYNVPTQFASATQGNQAVAEFEQAYFYPSDLTLFQANFSLPKQPLAKIIGKNKPDVRGACVCSGPDVWRALTPPSLSVFANGCAFLRRATSANVPLTWSTSQRWRPACRRGCSASGRLIWCSGPKPSCPPPARRTFTPCRGGLRKPSLTPPRSTP